MATSAGTPLSKRRRSDSSSCSPLSVTARRLLVARCEEGTLVTHPSSWRPTKRRRRRRRHHVDDKGARRTTA